ncbi:MAG: hypothetical protein PVI01_08050, partial [Gemmatimonadales bacterium]
MRLANGFACSALLCTAILVPVCADGQARQATQATDPDTSLWPASIRFETIYIGVAHARNGTPFMDARAAQRQPHERAETTIELSYNLYLTTQV